MSAPIAQPSGDRLRRHRRPLHRGDQVAVHAGARVGRAPCRPRARLRGRSLRTCRCRSASGVPSPVPAAMPATCVPWPWPSDAPSGSQPPPLKFLRVDHLGRVGSGARPVAEVEVVEVRVVRVEPGVEDGDPHAGPVTPRRPTRAARRRPPVVSRVWSTSASWLSATTTSTGASRSTQGSAATRTTVAASDASSNAGRAPGSRAARARRAAASCSRCAGCVRPAGRRNRGSRRAW